MTVEGRVIATTAGRLVRHHGVGRGGNRVVVALVVCALALAAISSSGVRRALTLSFSKQAQPFTELYFTPGAALSHPYRPGVPQRLAFTVKNHEGHPVTYSFGVYANDVKIAQKVTPPVPDGASSDVVQDIRIPDGGGRVEIVVRDLGSGQSIHYWATKVR